MARPVKLEVAIRMAWWWPVYVNALVFFCLCMGREPCPERLKVMVARAMRVSMVPAPAKGPE